ncbi:MAG: AI-2E family transporter [Ruminococcaceae bacterium]|nr:AI-2E family transporter [Oscillospiraceae bacterium]
MSDFKGSPENAPKPSAPRRSPRGMMIFALFGILIVLIVANLDALLKPIKVLNDILAPIFIGLVIAYLCNPILRFFELKVFYRLKRRVANRAFSMLMTYLVALLLIAGMVLLIIPQLVDSFNDLRTNGLFYINNLIDTINRLVASLPFELPTENGDNLLNFEKLLTFLVNWIGDYGSSLMNNIGIIAGGALTFLKNMLVGIFVSIYVLLSKDRLNAVCRRIFHALLSEGKEKKLLYYAGKANSKFGGFLVGKLVDSLMVGLTCALFFTIFKIPYPILIAVIIGVTDIIPFFGPFIGAIPSAIIIFITSPSKAIVFVILILVVQQIDGNLLAPMILGDHTGVTSLGVLVAITVFGGLFGFIGMLLGVPLYALIMTIVDDYIKHRLKEKGSPTDLYSYYPANAFIKPSDEEEVPHITITQKFVRWVAAVEPEMKKEGYSPSPFRICVNGIRMGLLRFGRFFHRIFSTKQLPEDQEVTIFKEISQSGMPAERSFWRTLVLSVVTLGIYPLYLIEVMSECTNIACCRDGKRTWGVFPYVFLGIVTLGIYPLIWHCQMIRRFREQCKEHGEECRISLKFYLLWSLLGFPILVGPLIAFYRFLAAFNRMCAIFNETHVFPVSRESILKEAEEAARAREALLEARKAAEAELLEHIEEAISFEQPEDEAPSREEADARTETRIPISDREQP